MYNYNSAVLKGNDSVMIMAARIDASQILPSSARLRLNIKHALGRSPLMMLTTASRFGCRCRAGSRRPRLISTLQLQWLEWVNSAGERTLRRHDRCAASALHCLHALLHRHLCKYERTFSVLI